MLIILLIVLLIVFAHKCSNKEKYTAEPSSTKNICYKGCNAIYGPSAEQAAQNCYKIYPTNATARYNCYKGSPPVKEGEACYAQCNGGCQ